MCCVKSCPCAPVTLGSRQHMTVPSHAISVTFIDCHRLQCRLDLRSNAWLVAVQQARYNTNAYQVREGLLEYRNTPHPFELAFRSCRKTVYSIQPVRILLMMLVSGQATFGKWAEKLLGQAICFAAIRPIIRVFRSRQLFLAVLPQCTMLAVFAKNISGSWAGTTAHFGAPSST